MLDGLLARGSDLLRRLRRLERREVREFRAWVENTQNLLHLSVLVVLPLLLGAVTFVANAVDLLPFLLFPPLASGSYVLFAQPESRYASPRRFVGGLTAGALCGWIAVELTATYWYQVPPTRFSPNPGAVAFGIFLTGVVTWALDVEESQSFSTALLVLVTGVTQFVYVVSVFLSTLVVSGVFLLWRERFYERRARFLYQSTKGDDHVLVPMRGENPEPTAMLGARLAVAHDAGKVVLLDLVDEGDVAAAEAELRSKEATTEEERSADIAADGGEESTLAERAEERAASETANRLEQQSRRIESAVGVPCQVVVAVAEGAPAAAVQRTARETNCDLVATPYETHHGALSPFVRDLFAGETDVLVHRSTGDSTTWKRVLVPVRRTGDVAHAMLDFATRLAGRTGHIAACHCIDSERERRRAESMLADLVETFEGPIETRIAKASIESFLGRTATQYDLVIMGASTERSKASRFVSPPTFERIEDLPCDIAILDRNFES